MGVPLLAWPQAAAATDEKTTLKIAGSSTVLPLAEVWAEDFNARAGDDVLIAGGGSSTGAQRVCLGAAHPEQADIADMSRKWEPWEAVVLDDGYTYECAGSKVRVSQITVGLDAIVVVTARNGSAARCLASRGVGGLTLAQLRWIFSDLSDDALSADGLDMNSVVPNNDGDTIKEWSDLDASCSETPIRLYGAGDKSGTASFFSEAIFCPERMHRTRARCAPEDFRRCPNWTAASAGQFWSPNCYNASEDDYEILDWVLADPGAITYIGFGYAQRWAAKLELVAVASDIVKGVKGTQDALVPPTINSIVDGSYSVFRRELYMNVRNEAWYRAKDFMSYGFSNEGQVKLAEIGVIPLNMALKAKMEQRIQQRANLKADYLATTTVFAARPAPQLGKDEYSPTEVVAIALVAFSVISLMVLGLYYRILLRRARRQSAQRQSAQTMQVNHAVVAALSLLPALCDDIIHLDEELRIVRPCPKLANMLCLPSEAMASCIFADLLSAEDAARFKEHLPMSDPSSDCSQGGFTPCCNVELIGGNGMQVSVRVFGSSWEDGVGGRGYVIGLCQTDETIPIPAMGDGGPSAARMYQALYTTLTPQNHPYSETMSSHTDRTNITTAFGSIIVIFDALDVDFRIIWGSRAFAAVANIVPEGLSLLKFVRERKSFVSWVQPQVNDFFEKKELPAKQIRLTLHAKNRRRVSVLCRLAIPSSLELDNVLLAAAAKGEGGEEDEDDDVFPLCALLEEPEWETAGTVDSDLASKASRPRSRLAQCSSVASSLQPRRLVAAL